MVAEPQSPGLIRALGLWDVTAIPAGTILRSAIFVAAAFVPRAVPHPTLALLLWVAGGLQGAALFIGEKTAAASRPSHRRPVEDGDS